MDGILAFAGLIMLAVGLLAFFAAVFMSIAEGFAKDAVTKAARQRWYKKAFIVAGLLLLVGTGVCTLQFTLYPLKFN